MFLTCNCYFPPGIFLAEGENSFNYVFFVKRQKAHYLHDFKS